MSCKVFFTRCTEAKSASTDYNHKPDSCPKDKKHPFHITAFAARDKEQSTFFAPLVISIPPGTG